MAIYKDDSISVKGHITGYVSEKDLDKTNIPDTAVTDCSNMDFYPDHDRRRPTYDIYKDLAQLLPGHTIINFHFKTFYDFEGNEKEMIIIAAKDNASGRIKIFTTAYYCPKNAGYENFTYESPTGFNNKLTEITERIDPSNESMGSAIEAGEWDIGGNIYHYRFPCESPLPYGYYVGFFTVTDTNDILGIVVESVQNIQHLYFNVANAPENKIQDHISSVTVTGKGWGYTNISLLSPEALGGDPDATFRVAYEVTNPASITITSGKLDPNTVYKSVNVPEGSAPFKFSTDGGGGIYQIVQAGYYLDNPPTNNIGVILDSEPDGMSPEATVSVGSWSINSVNVLNEGNYMPDTISLTCSGNATLEVVTLRTNTPRITGLVRFPIVQYKRWFFAGSYGTPEVNFIDNNSSSVKILFGNKCDMLWLGMIADRKYFGDAYTETQGYDEIGKFSWVNWINVSESFKATVVNEETIKFRITATVTDKWRIKLYVKRNSEAEYLFATHENAPDSDVYWTVTIIQGFSIGIHCNISSLDFSPYTYHIVKTSISRKWDGFWFTQDSYELPDRKQYLYFKGSPDPPVYEDKYGSITNANELGFRINITANRYSVNPAKDSRGYSLCCELDGYQTLFIKNILCASKEYIKLCSFQFERHFDRRLTAFLLFYDEFTGSPEVVTHDDMFPLTYQAIGDTAGRLEIGKINTDSNGNSIWFKDDYLYPPDNISPLKFAATGLKLGDYLNEYYYSKHITRAKNGINLDNLIILYGIEKPQDETEVIQDSGYICISQYQGNGIGCNSIFSLERRKQVSREKIVGVRCLAGGDFLVFTKEKAYWYELKGFDTALLSNIGDFETYGSLSDSSIVGATVMDNADIGTASREFGAKQFKGIYWANSKTIYGFFGNEPLDLLENRWKMEYNTYTTAQKENIIAGYNPEKGEVWFLLKTTNKSDIFIFNIAGKHWKKYKFNDVPTKFYYSRDGRIMWTDGNKIFKMDGDNDGKTKDKEVLVDSAVAINFFIEKYINHKTPTFWKIPIGFKIAYEVSNKSTTSSSILVEVKDFKSNTILSSTFALTGDMIKKSYPKRTHTIWYKMKISDDNTTNGNIKILKINAIQNNALLTIGKIIEGD